MPLILSLLGLALGLVVVKAQIEANGGSAPTMSPAEFGAFIDRQTRVWEKVVAPLDIQLD